MSLQLPLAKVKGMGASGEGSRHWWHQRLSALVLIPLTIWFLFSIVDHLGESRQMVLQWIAHPLTAICLIVYSMSMLYHAQLGIQVVIEDYVHRRGLRLTLLLLAKAVLLICGVLAVFSVLRIAL